MLGRQSGCERQADEPGRVERTQRQVARQRAARREDRERRQREKRDRERAHTELRHQTAFDERPEQREQREGDAHDERAAPRSLQLSQGTWRKGAR